MKFLEISELLKTMNISIAEEKVEYKKYILNTVDPKINNLFNSEQVGLAFRAPELVQLFKEGEVRFKYKIPPGYENEENKDGKEKFGDLIIWKQLIKEAKNSKYFRVFYVTSDNKPDWFEKQSSGKNTPCHELIDEFHYECGEKEIFIVPMSNFIDNLRDGNQTDRELILNLRKDTIVKNIDDELIGINLNKFIKEIQRDILNNHTPENLANGISVSTLQCDEYTLRSSNLRIINNEIKYELELEVRVIGDSEVEHYGYIEYGQIVFEGTAILEVNRDLLEKESDFYSSIKTRINVTEIDILNSQYVWCADNSLEDDGRTEMYETMEDYYKH